MEIIYIFRDMLLIYFVHIKKASGIPLNSVYPIWIILEIILYFLINGKVWYTVYKVYVFIL